jgi:hypothetical protein
MINRMIGAGFLFLLVLNQAYAQTDPLPSWNDGAAKQAIVEFVKTTTDKASPKFVPPAERIAAFDQDGTLWVEHPVYTQFMYCLDRVGALVKEKPELKNVEPFKTVLSGDREAIAKLSDKALFEIVLATQSGMTEEEFRTDVEKWLATAKDPRWKRPYTELTYQPMQEVLKYLRASGYKSYTRPAAARASYACTPSRYTASPRAGGRYRAGVQVRLRQGPPADPH